MKLRTLLFTLVLVIGFWVVTQKVDLPRFSSSTAKLWTGPITAEGAGYSTDEQNNIDIYKNNRAATVNITSRVYQQDFFFRVYPADGTGSGFIINEKGQIITNYHVIKGSQEISVTLSDTKKYPAKVLGVDSRNDLALLEIKTDRKLPFVHLGDSEGIQVGQKVLAIGDPFGLKGTLTTGIVSSLGRSLDGETGRLEGLIQTDAAINPGNSGGPLLDSHGNVIGINTAIFGAQTSNGQAGSIGIGFAMPVNRAKAILDEFNKSGKISRPFLGAQTLFVQGDLAEALRLPASGGLLIEAIERGSPAESIGMQGPTQVVVVGGYQVGIGGDLIVAIEGQPVDSQDALQRAMRNKRAGEKLDLTILRKNRNTRISVTLGAAPERF